MQHVEGVYRSYPKGKQKKEKKKSHETFFHRIFLKQQQGEKAIFLSLKK